MADTTRATRRGVLYAIQIAPELSLKRIKFGWTSQLPYRLRQHRSSAPTARVYAAWPCQAQYEHLLVRTVMRRQRQSQQVGPETYDVDNLREMAERMDYCAAKLNEVLGLGWAEAESAIAQPETEVQNPPQIAIAQPVGTRSQRRMAAYWQAHPLTEAEQRILQAAFR